jgi:DNA-binding LytR/AlgR family response regulator
MNVRRVIGLALMLACAAMGCEKSRYAGPGDAGDVDLELQTGGWIFVPVDEIQTFEASDSGTLVWTDEDTFVVRESPGEIRERMASARRDLRGGG